MTYGHFESRDCSVELNPPEGAPELCVGVSPERVQVLPEGSDEEDGVLGDDRDAGAEVSQPEAGNVQIVNMNRAVLRLHDPEEGGDEGTLPGTRSPNDSDLEQEYMEY